MSGRALSLLIKRGNNTTAVPTPRPEGVEVTYAADVDCGVVDAAKNNREKKRSRHEKEAHHLKKHSHVADPTGGLPLEGALVAGSSSRDAGLDSGSLGERPGSIMIEIGPEARWHLGDQQPVQAFGAFRLARDANSYEGFSREEIVLRSRRRLGMFILDYERLLIGVDEEIREACEREVAALRRELSESNQRLCDMTSRGEEATRRFEAEEKSRAKDKEKFSKKIADLEEELSRCRLNGDEFKRERDAAQSHNIALVNEVAALKTALAEGDEELVQSLTSGYNACLDRLVAAGMDCGGHSFEDYCVTLRAEETGGRNKELP